jgi:hypothetical protein
MVHVHQLASHQGEPQLSPKNKLIPGAADAVRPEWTLVRVQVRSSQHLLRRSTLDHSLPEFST